MVTIFSLIMLGKVLLSELVWIGNFVLAKIFIHKIAKFGLIAGWIEQLLRLNNFR